MPSAVVAPQLRGANWRRRPGPLRRLRVRLNSSKLDRALAGGASPSESSELSIRAGQLTTESQREEIATSIDAVLELTGGEKLAYLGRGRIPLDRNRIVQNRAELERLSERLRSADRVRPRGVAMARLLVSDFRGPLYTWGPARQLTEALDATLSELES